MAAFNLATLDLADQYRGLSEFGNWEPATRPGEDVFLDCLYKPRTSVALDDRLLDEICTRQQRTRLLRNLQLGHCNTPVEYGRFRTNLVNVPAKDGSYPNVSNGFSALPGPDRPSMSKQISKDFPERFKKQLCLQFLAVKTRPLTLATATTNRPDPSIAELASPVWASWKPALYLGRDQHEFGLQDKVDPLELFDFIYYFLLGKAFSTPSLNKWIRACCNASLFKAYHPRSRSIKSFSRFELLSNLRWHLDPLDVIAKS